MRSVSLLMVAILLTSSVGCVDRRFIVTTNVPGAQVYMDDKPVGASPADGRWEYSGYYKFTAVAPGYEPTVKRIRFRPRWFEYPPLDFFAEVLYPFRIEDVRQVELELFPVKPVNQEAIIDDAESLRNRGQTLPPTQVPDTKKTATTPARSAEASPLAPQPNAPKQGPW